MGKVVKFCSACEEGFAEKFGFCPNCGAHLTAFEMNPLDHKPAAATSNETVEAAAAPSASAPIVEESPAKTSPAVETQQFSAEAATNEPAASEEIFEADTKVFDADEVETKYAFETPKTVPSENVAENLHEASYAKNSDADAAISAPHYVADTGYQPTLVVEKNVKQRNTLLLGAFALGCMLMLTSYVYSMFNKYLDISAIETPSLVAYVGNDDPTSLELEEPPKINKDDGGGGGGGGRDEENPVQKGREATQTDNPLFAPSKTYDKVTDPDIAIRAATQGNRTAPQTNEPYGLRNGGNIPSDGDGTGGGQGGGRGTGQGNGQGTGLGNGNGSGFGNGNGNGNGDGDGDGDNLPQVKPSPKPPTPVGPTEGVKILSKPRANYTDAARQNQVQGKVVLRVTFSANGSIGAISVVSGLGNGLTEQAIAAARGIRFEPAKRGGVPYTVSKPVEYTFTIY